MMFSCVWGDHVFFPLRCNDTWIFRFCENLVFLEPFPLVNCFCIPLAPCFLKVLLFARRRQWSLVFLSCDVCVQLPYSVMPSELENVASSLSSQKKKKKWWFFSKDIWNLSDVFFRIHQWSHLRRSFSLWEAFKLFIQSFYLL